MQPRHVRRNVLLLALCQALFATSNAVMITSAALAGQQLAPHPGLATVPLGLQFLATMATTLPASLLMKRIGRRAGFMLGGGFGILAGIAGWLAIMAGWFWLFCLAGLLYGAFVAFAMYYRFAAADVADAAFRPRAIAYVLGGGLLAAFAGPWLAEATSDLFAPVLFAGCYAAIAALGALTLLVLAAVRIPPPDAAERAESGRPLRQIAAQRPFIMALCAGALGQGTMVLIMTATPLAMAVCGFGIGETALVIQWHIVGMFAPSFVTGHLIGRFGTRPVMITGCVLLMLSLAINLSGVALAQFWAALLLLGVGWNFTFVGATDLLTTTYRPAEKAKVQAINDLTVFAVAALGSFLSGALHHLIGWQAVNLGFFLPLGLLLLALICLQQRPLPTPAAS